MLRKRKADAGLARLPNKRLYQLYLCELAAKQALAGAI
jgi:hypothetical protein